MESWHLRANNPPWGKLSAMGNGDRGAQRVEAGLIVRQVGHVLTVRAVRSKIDDRGISLANVIDGKQVLSRAIPGQRHVVQRRNPDVRLDLDAVGFPARVI